MRSCNNRPPSLPPSLHHHRSTRPLDCCYYQYTVHTHSQITDYDEVWSLKVAHICSCACRASVSSEHVTSATENTCSRSEAWSNVSIQPSSLPPLSFSRWMTTALSIKGLFKGVGQSTGAWNPDLTGNRVLKNLLVRDSNFLWAASKSWRLQSRSSAVGQDAWP